MKHKAVAVGREYERNVESDGVVESLLHPVADAVIVVLRLNDGDRDIGLVIKDVIGALGFATSNELPPDDDTSLGEGDLLTDLHHPIPSSTFYCRADEFGADIAFAEVFLVHVVIVLNALSEEFSSNNASFIHALTSPEPASAVDAADSPHGGVQRTSAKRRFVERLRTLTLRREAVEFSLN